MDLEKENVRSEEEAAPAAVRTDVEPPEQMSKKKQWFWTAVFALIAALSILAVVMQSREFSLGQFVSYVGSASLPWLGVSLLSMLGFVLFEGIAILCLCRAFGYKKGMSRGYIYSASDIYFSAITPSASGGQPASALFMVKDGIPPMLVTAILVANLCMYTLSIIAIGFICFLFRFGVFLDFHFTSKLLIIVGVLAQLGLALFFGLLLKNGRLLHRISRATLRFLMRIGIIRRKKEEKMQRLDAAMEKYRGYAEMLTKHKKALFLAFVFNFLQRASQIAVTLFTYLATGGSASRAFSVFAMQGYVVLGSNCVPIPGAMGISDYIMLDGFRAIMSESEAVNLELLSRACSFYVCIFLCGISTLIYFQLLKKRRNSL